MRALLLAAPEAGDDTFVYYSLPLGVHIAQLYPAVLS